MRACVNAAGHDNALFSLLKQLEGRRAVVNYRGQGGLIRVAAQMQCQRCSFEAQDQAGSRIPKPWLLQVARVDLAEQQDARIVEANALLRGCCIGGWRLRLQYGSRKQQ